MFIVALMMNKYDNDMSSQVLKEGRIIKFGVKQIDQ